MLNRYRPEQEREAMHAGKAVVEAFLLLEELFVRYLVWREVVLVDLVLYVRDLFWHLHVWVKVSVALVRFNPNDRRTVP